MARFEIEATHPTDEMLARKAAYGELMRHAARARASSVNDVRITSKFSNRKMEFVAKASGVFVFPRSHTANRRTRRGLLSRKK
jgi:hypothetical protein